MKTAYILRADTSNDEELALHIETDFSKEELLEAAEKIHDDLMDTDDGWNEEKVIQELEKKGYLKVLGKAPAVLDLYL